MDINAEKQEAIKRLDQIQDLSVIRAVRYLIDLGLASQAANSQTPAAASDQPIPQPATEATSPTHRA
jgi:hypothetical protein